MCVQRCTLVMERLMKTNFPSWTHLDQPNYITHKHCRYTHTHTNNMQHKLSCKYTHLFICVCVCCRLYLQFCVSDLIIISPSAAMSVSLMEKKRDQTDRRQADGDSLRSACVSVIFRLNSKQGVMFRNTSVSADPHTLQMGFTATVSCLGDVQIWKKDPKNRRIQTRETDGPQTTVRHLHQLYTV